MNYKKDYYGILGVDEKATPEALRASYRRLAKLYHPDRNPGVPAIEERFKAINEAYEILSNHVSRHIYDSYRESAQKEAHTRQPAGNPVRPPSSFSTTKTRTRTVTREKRIYVRGTIEVKFHGDPELQDTYARQWEQRFTIIPTEVCATITSSDIYKDEPPKEFQLGYSTAALFATPLKQPIHCKVITGGREEYYTLDLYDIRVKDPVLKDITRYEQFSLGTLEGKLFGYLLHRYNEEITEEYTEHSGPTGQVEIQVEPGYILTRQQFYTNDGNTYWTEWVRNQHYTPPPRVRATQDTPFFRKRYNYGDNWLWLLVLLVSIAIWPKLLYIVLPFAISILLALLAGWFTSSFNRILPWLCALVIGTIVVLSIRSQFPGPLPHTHNSSRNRFDSISSAKTIVRNNHHPDTIITHSLHWTDRDSRRFAIQLSIPLSALRRSAAAHEQMNEQQYVMQGMGAVYRFMLNTDNNYTKPIAAAFDSLARERSLSRQQEASMIVSCIQSIPYTLVVDRSCSASYPDDFTNQYLANCNGNCCKGYSKFGVQSPLEFIGDLKGDCDTRALLLYDLLGKLGYQVALMTSNYYKHALIAVHLDKAPPGNAVAVHINGHPYYLWETTAKGFGPGELPDALSNTTYWNIALIQ